MIDWQLLNDARQQVRTRTELQCMLQQRTAHSPALAATLVRMCTCCCQPTPPCPAALPPCSPVPPPLQEGSRWFELWGDPFDVPQPSSVFVGFIATSGKLRQAARPPHALGNLSHSPADMCVPFCLP
jgi:hypothetical protein